MPAEVPLVAAAFTFKLCSKFDLIDFDIWPESRRTPTKTLTADIRVLASGDASVDNSTVPRMVGDAEGVAVANRR